MGHVYTKLLSQNLNLAPLSGSFVVGEKLKLCQVLFNGGAAITETLTITHDAAEGSTNDVVLDTSSLSSAQYYVFRPTGTCVFEKGDACKVVCTNATATSTAKVKIQMERL